MRLTKRVRNIGLQLNQDKMAVTTDAPPAKKRRGAARKDDRKKHTDVQGDSRN